MKLPAIWTDEKAEVGRVREEKRRSKKIREEKADAGAQKGRKVAKYSVCANVLGLWRVEKYNRLAKAAGAKPSGEMRDLRFGPLLEVEMFKKCRPLWREAHFEVNMLKTPHVWTTFGRSGRDNKYSYNCTTTTTTITPHYTTTTTTTTATVHYTTVHYTALITNYYC